MRDPRPKKRSGPDGTAVDGGDDAAKGERLLNVDDVSNLLGVPRATIYQLTHRGRIPHFKIANRLRFRRSEILDWIEDRRVRKHQAAAGRPIRTKESKPLTRPE